MGGFSSFSEGNVGLPLLLLLLKYQGLTQPDRLGARCCPGLLSPVCILGSWALDTVPVEMDS